jgi:glyoxylase-like metal-dependent hydrolase (beta-lactamase superfamily II)
VHDLAVLRSTRGGFDVPRLRGSRDEHLARGRAGPAQRLERLADAGAAARAHVAVLRRRHGLHELHAGDSIGVGGGVKLRAIATPGHSPDSLSYFLEDEGVLFTGDTILGEGTTTVNDMADYLESLQRLRDLPNLRVICPGHGPLIEDPSQRIDLYLRHRTQRERQVITALTSGDAQTSWQIMEQLYPGINPRLRRSADGNVRAHLRKLEKDGRIKVYEGKRRQPTETETAQAGEQEHARLEVMRQADAYREEARRRTIFLQENPPANEWEEPPRYELI